VTQIKFSKEFEEGEMIAVICLKFQME